MSNVNVWFGGGYQIPYRLPSINLKYSDVIDPDPECLKPIHGTLISKTGDRAKISVDDVNWLNAIGCDKPFLIECSKLPKNSFLRADEYAWSE